MALKVCEALRCLQNHPSFLSVQRTPVYFGSQEACVLEGTLCSLALQCILSLCILTAVQWRVLWTVVSLLLGLLIPSLSWLRGVYSAH